MGAYVTGVDADGNQTRYYDENAFDQPSTPAVASKYGDFIGYGGPASQLFGGLDANGTVGTTYGGTYANWPALAKSLGLTVDDLAAGLYQQSGGKGNDYLWQGEQNATADALKGLDSKFGTNYTDQFKASSFYRPDKITAEQQAAANTYDARQKINSDGSGYGANFGGLGGFLGLVGAGLGAGAALGGLGGAAAGAAGSTGAGVGSLGSGTFGLDLAGLGGTATGSAGLGSLGIGATGTGAVAAGGGALGSGLAGLGAADLGAVGLGGLASGGATGAAANGAANGAAETWGANPRPDVPTTQPTATNTQGGNVDWLDELMNTGDMVDTAGALDPFANLPSGPSGLDVPGGLDAINPGGSSGGMGLTDQFKNLLSQGKNIPTSIIKSLFGTDDATSASLAKMFGTGVGGVLDYMSTSKAADNAKAIADRTWGAGQLYRDNAARSMSPGFDLNSIPGYSGALSTGMDAFNRSLSAKGGNPWGQGGAAGEAISWAGKNIALPAWQNYFNSNSNAGGLSSLATQSTSAGLNAGAADSAGYGSLGQTARNLLAPEDPSAQFYKLLGKQYGLA